MKLYYKPGSCSLSVHIALNEIGADFEIEEVDTAAQRTKSGADYAAINPNGYVPALAVSNDVVLSEAPAVLQYLADQKPETGLAPAPGTMERIRLQHFLNFVASELHKAFSPFFSGTPLSKDLRAAAEAKVARRMDYLESVLADSGSYLMGGVFTVADSYAFVVASWSKHVGIDLGRWPNTAAYVKRISERPSVVKAMTAEGLIAA